MPHRRTTAPTALAIAVVTALAATACRGGDPLEEPDEVIRASPLTPASPPPSPADPPSPSPSPTGTAASPTPSPDAASPRPATDTDRARFVQSHRPEGASDLEHVAVDLDGDGTEELVFAYVGPGDTARVDVAWWDGTEYRVVDRTEGGPATRIDRLRVNDINADGVTEVVTFQSTSGSGASLSVWQLADGRALRGLRARGGCADGLHTYGVVGAELEDRDGDGVPEIRATCDGSPLPMAAWPTHTYVWDRGAYRHRGELDD